MNTTFAANRDQSLVDNALSAFHIGMANLLAQVGHWNADYSNIIKSNLRLLHQTLLKIPEYRRQIKRLQHLGSITQKTRQYKTAQALLQKFQQNTCSRPMVIPASANPAMLTLHQGPFSPGTESHIQAHLMCLPTGYTIRIPRRTTEIRLYMPICGKARTLRNGENLSSSSTWWRRLVPSSTRHTRLKHGELLISGVHQTEEIVLRAERQTCILLCIGLKFTFTRPTNDLPEPQPFFPQLFKSISF